MSQKKTETIRFWKQQTEREKESRNDWSHLGDISGREGETIAEL